MDDQQVYLEKLSAFSRMLRMQGLNVSPQETADACRILIEVGLENRDTVRQALRTIYAKSREEQLIFDRVFDGFFISEEAMRQQAKEQAERETEMEQVRKESMEDLQINGQPMMLSQQQRDTYAAMSKQERKKLLDFLERYKTSAERNPNLYGNFIHSVFTFITHGNNFAVKQFKILCNINSSANTKYSNFKFSHFIILLYNLFRYYKQK